jgi:hypothetical protein
MKKGAIKRKRYHAELFAQLVSYPSLDNLTEREQRQFLGLVRKTAFSFAHVENERGQWAVLQHVHSIVRPLLIQFLAGEEMPLQPLAERERASAKLTPSGSIGFHTEGEGLQEEMVVELYRLVRRGGAFPLRQCAHCKTKIFVRVRRQQYCSVACRNQANDARRDPVERREYQRQLMRDRRAAGKEPKRSQKKARARGKGV